MFDIRNHTPFAVGVVPSLDKDGVEHATIVVKATFDLAAAGAVPPVAAEQVPLTAGDQFYGDPAETSIRYESDYSPTKPGTNVVLVGHARPPGEVTEAEVSLRAGPLGKTIRVIGDRRWTRAAGRWLMSDPLPFSAMPLTFERAFGGMDQSGDDPAEHGCEERNPVGTGYVAKNKRAERIDGLRLPNLEDPLELINEPEDKPAPVGYGFIGRHWRPRRDYAGTYDEAWRDHRCPLIPLDFDDRFHNSAPAELTAPFHFSGGEPVRVMGVRAEGMLAFELPKRDKLLATTMIKAVRENHFPVLDTVLIEPDEMRLVLVYRVTLPCPQSFMLIDYVRIAEEEPT